MASDLHAVLVIDVLIHGDRLIVCLRGSTSLNLAKVFPYIFNHFIFKFKEGVRWFFFNMIKHFLRPAHLFFCFLFFPDVVAICGF